MVSGVLERDNTSALIWTFSIYYYYYLQENSKQIACYVPDLYKRNRIS